MIVVKEMLFFMFAQFLMVVALCLIIGGAWILNLLCKELLDIDVISLMKLGRKKNENL